MLRWILGGLAALVLVLVALFFWPGWLRSDDETDEPAPVVQAEPAPVAEPAAPAASTSAAAKERCEAFRAECVEVLKDEDRCATLAAECEQALASCPECQAGPPAEVAKCLDRCKQRCEAQAKTGGGKGKKRGGHAGQGDSATAGGGTDTSPKLHGPAEVEVSDNKVCVKTTGYTKVAFFGSHGVCPENVRYVGLDGDGCAVVPGDLPAECRWFNLVTSEGKWAVVAGGTSVKGATIVKEQNGPFSGAHAYSL